MPFKNYIAEINLGQEGLSGTRNKTLLQPTELLDATNVTFFGGIIGKEGGAAKYNTVAVPTAGTILGGHDWHPDNSTQRMVVYTSGGYLLKDSGAGDFTVTLASGLLSTATPVFVEGGQETLAGSKKLFTFNGFDPVKVLSGDGVTASTIATPPADWVGTNQPNCGCIHEGRMWGALGHRVYFSTTGNHEDFTGAGSGQVAVSPGTGSKILFISSFKGVLCVFKEDRGLFIIDTSSYDFTSSSTPKVMVINQNIGLKSSQGVTQIDDDLLFMDAAGSIQLFSGIDNFNITGSNLSQLHEMNSFIQDNVNTAQLQHVKVAFYAAQREVHFAVPITGLSYNAARLVVDLNIPSNPRFRWSPRDICESLWLRRDSSGIPRLVCGDTTGFVWLLDQEARSKDGAGYMGSFQTPYMDFGGSDATVAARQKLGAELEIIAEPRDGVVLYVDVFWDTFYRHTVTFDLNPRGTPLGEFVFGVDVLGSADLVSRRRRKILGSGRTLSLAFYNSDAAGDFAVARAFVRFKVGNERLSRQ